MKKEDRVKRTISKLIEAPKEKVCRPGVDGFGDTLASTVLELSNRDCGFDESFNLIMETRLALAIFGNDFETIKTLMIFPQTRGKGLCEEGRKGESITGIVEDEQYGDLYRKIKRSFFPGCSRYYEMNYTCSDNLSWVQKLHLHEEGKKILIHHAHNSIIPPILSYLSRLWEDVQSCSDLRRIIHLLAAFEWWFIAPNITGNAGASIGNCLSLTLQCQKNLPLAQHFEHLDWNVLSMTLEDYILHRTRQITVK